MPGNQVVRRLAAASIILFITTAFLGYLLLKRDRRNTEDYGKIRTDSVVARKEPKLMFNNIPLRQLVGMINEQYGAHVRLEDESTGDKTISGILPNDNLDVLLKSLQATMEFRIDRQGDYITIRKRS